MQNYKVFINDHLIFFEQKAKFTPQYANAIDCQFIEQKDLTELVQIIKKNSVLHTYCLFSDNPQNDFKVFTSNFQTIEAAGGLVLNERNELLMIHRFEKWDFPKGHVEKNESIAEAAIREVTEETGVQNLQIIQKLPCTYHMYDNHGEQILKKSHWYLMKTNFKSQLKPQIEEAILAAIWVPAFAIDEYMQKSYPALKDLVRHLQQLEILKP